MKPEIVSAAFDAGVDLVNEALRAAVSSIEDLGAMPPQGDFSIDVKESLRLFILSQVAERCLDEMEPEHAKATALTFAEGVLKCVGVTPEYSRSKDTP